MKSALRIRSASRDTDRAEQGDAPFDLGHLCYVKYLVNNEGRTELQAPWQKESRRSSAADCDFRENNMTTENIWVKRGTGISTFGASLIVMAAQLRLATLARRVLHLVGRTSASE
jgi:hypothetical protein